MIPRWKLKRELNRIKEQFQQLPWLLYGGVQKRLYDRAKHRKIKVEFGQLTKTDIGAVFLIYQPKGLLQSTIAQLEYFASRGVSTVVVSNAPLSGSDLEIIKRHTLLVIQRPNFGYDFGGYRDGILQLQEMDLQFDNLFVLNDSVWMPLLEQSDPIESALASPADLFGISFFKHPRKPHLSHIQSYFFRFNKNVLRDPYFYAYWHEMPVSSNRYTVIRKCEMGLTQAFASKGFETGVMYDDQDSSKHLLSLTNEEMISVIRYLSDVAPRYKAIFSSVLEKAIHGEDWRDEVFYLIENEQSVIPFLLHHPFVLIDWCVSPIIKKDRKGPYWLQREELRRTGHLSMINPIVASEISEWDRVEKPEAAS